MNAKNTFTNVGQNMEDHFANVSKMFVLGFGAERQVERYPKMGVSPRQLWNMKKFYERYAEHDEKVLRSVALLPWSHNLLLLSKGLDDDATLY